MIFWIILIPGKDTPPTIHSPGPRLVLLFKGVIFVAFPSKVFVAFPSKVSRGGSLHFDFVQAGRPPDLGSRHNTHLRLSTRYQVTILLISKLNGPKDTLLMHPEPSSNHHSEYENQNGHNSNYQELQDQARAISHTGPQVALMEGGRFTRSSFVY